MTTTTKRRFLLGSASALAASPSLALDAGRQLAGVAARLDERSGLATWWAYLGQEFEIDGQRFTLKSASARDARSEQFSLDFAPAQSAPEMGEGLRELRHASGACLPLFLVETGTGLRADFARHG